MPNAIYDIPLRRIDGTAASLGEYRGKVLLIVNVASACGLTPQYTGLEKLYEDHRDAGLVVAGFPANDFGAQEPGSNAEIAEFCTTRFGVRFPMFEKISVKGATQHPLYRQLQAARPRATEKPGSDFRAKLASYGIAPGDPGEVLWNFEKFLVGREGEVAGRFAPDVTAEDPLLIEAIQAELARR